MSQTDPFERLGAELRAAADRAPATAPRRRFALSAARVAATVLVLAASASGAYAVFTAGSTTNDLSSAVMAEKAPVQELGSITGLLDASAGGLARRVSGPHAPAAATTIRRGAIRVEVAMNEHRLCLAIAGQLACAPRPLAQPLVVNVRIGSGRRYLVAVVPDQIATLEIQAPGRNPVVLAPRTNLVVVATGARSATEVFSRSKDGTRREVSAAPLSSLHPTVKRVSRPRLVPKGSKRAAGG